jgi:hypothetical protein
MINDRLKSIIRQIVEGLAVVFLVLCCFALLFVGLNYFFPSGTSLKELVSHEDIVPFADLSIHGDREFTIDRSREVSEMSAVLEGIRNTVKAKRGGAIAWTPANVGMPLYDRDAIQTFRRASARIKLDAESFLDVEENTLVVIKRFEEDLFLREKESVLIMVDGKLRGNIKGDEEKSINVQIATPSAVTRVMSGESPGGKAKFAVTVNPDKSSTVTVYEGVAAVSAQDQVVHVEANQGITVNLDQVPPAPISLPPPPTPSSPENAFVYYYRDLPPKIRFSWAAGEYEETYHFVLSRAPGFGEIVEDGYIPEEGFSHGNLKEGHYYWRVSRLSGWVEGGFSETRMVRVVKDQAPPMLRVQIQDGVVQRPRVTLKGVTEPGSRVFVQGERVTIDSAGAFEHGVSLKRGTNVIVVEAVDAAGNVAYHADYVTGRF